MTTPATPPSPTNATHAADTDPQLAQARQTQRLRQPLRYRKLQVLRTERITPHLLRITVGGMDLQGFASPGFEDHCKLFFPLPETGQLPQPAITEDGTPDFKTVDRSLSRDYTPRSYNAEKNELVFDFALHDAGPATAWALRAKPGDLLGVGGPRGSFIIPTAFDWHLLAGDDTALPAIWRRLQELPAQTPVHVFAEVDSPADRIDLLDWLPPNDAKAQSERTANIHITWAYRNAHSPADAETDSALLHAITQAQLPAGDYFAWVACETTVSKAIREHLITQRNANPRWVRASGYWRKGTAAAHETHE